MKKTLIAMMLAGSFLVARPVLAGDDAPKPEKTEKAKGKKKKAKKDDSAAAAPEGDKAAPAGDKKADKAGW
jgi:hypothetical protein